jgi:hypothetical protein
MTWGTLEFNINLLKTSAAQNGYRITLDMIVDFILRAQKSKLDAHVLVGAQNGIGKSYLEMALAKCFLKKINQPPEFATAKANGKLSFFFSHNSREDLAESIKKNHLCVHVIDELRPFFDYKRSMTSKQTNLYNLVEIARSHGNVYIGASRDYMKLDNNYRNAKAQILIYLFDKVVDFNSVDKDGFYVTLFSYGAVFVGNPSLEHEDKFQFSNLRGYSIETTKYLCEKLPTWVGNIVVEHVSTYGVTTDDIAVYEAEKERGVHMFEQRAEEEKAPKKDRRKKEKPTYGIDTLANVPAFLEKRRGLS